MGRRESMIRLSLDRHDFVAAVEGFARGSHLRQHVWQQHVFSNIPQMSPDEMDFFWYVFRRNLWECYFRLHDGKTTAECGAEDYLQTLAALHRGNRYKIDFRVPGDRRKHTAICYRFMGKYRPLYADGYTVIEDFRSYVPQEYIRCVEQCNMPANHNVPEKDIEWWTDLEVYDSAELLTRNPNAAQVNKQP